VDSGFVYFRQISARDAARRRSLVKAASAVGLITGARQLTLEALRSRAV
jgi:hypothetical protein